MKTFTIISLLIVSCCVAGATPVLYHGCTPAGLPVRRFLGISLTDSMDFIRWRLEIDQDHYKLSCSYGLCQPSTNGFSNEQTVAWQGSHTKQGIYYTLEHNGKTFYIMEINASLLHLLDEKRHMLSGNGGWSYTLNNTNVVISGECLAPASKQTIQDATAFEGRTPCQPLSRLIKRQSSEACNKLKWFIIFFTDSITKQPAYYLIGGRQYRPETMRKGAWKIERRSDGRPVYILDPEKGEAAVHLLQAAENILLFTDGKGQLLVGNDDFSYTLSKTYLRHQ